MFSIRMIKKQSHSSSRFFSIFFVSLTGIILIILMLGGMNVKSELTLTSETIRPYPIEDLITVEPGTYYQGNFTYPASGIYVSITVEEVDRLGYQEVEEPPIDVLFMTPEQFQIYESSFNQVTHNSSYQGPWELGFLSITSVEFFLDDLEGVNVRNDDFDLGPLYMVIENANFTRNGASAFTSVSVKIILGETKLPRDSVPINVDNPSIFEIMALNVMNFLLSPEVIISTLTGIVGLVVGNTVIPRLISRINGADGYDKERN